MGTNIHYIQVTIEPTWYASRHAGPTKQLLVKVQTSDGQEHKITEMWDDDDFMTNFEYMMQYATRAILSHMNTKREATDEGQAEEKR